MKEFFEEKVHGTLLFVRNTPERELAEFIVSLSDKEFRKIYNKHGEISDELERRKITNHRTGLKSAG